VRRSGLALVGIKTTAGVVTSAAIVMVGVFAIFATLQAMILKQFGVGLAAAILIDATIVRAVLLPATMNCSATGTGTYPSGSRGYPASARRGREDGKSRAVPTTRGRSASRPTQRPSPSTRETTGG